MRKIAFYPSAFRDYVEWSTANKELFEKINDLIKEILREPYKGKGKPEPLKGNLKGSWSRRINLEHRLVYTVTNDMVVVISCHGHYE